MMCGSAIFPADFYVATTGSDSASGSAKAPFVTLERARAAVRSLKERNPGRATPIVVMVRGGSYYLKSPIQFTAADSGSERAPIVYQAYPGEKPVISGGRPITGWKLDPHSKGWTTVCRRTWKTSSSSLSTASGATGRARPRITICIWSGPSPVPSNRSTAAMARRGATGVTTASNSSPATSRRVITISPTSRSTTSKCGPWRS